MAENEYLRSLRREREHWTGILGSLERGDIIVGDDLFNERRIDFTRGHLSHLDKAIEAEESGYAQGMVTGGHRVAD